MILCFEFPHKHPWYPITYLHHLGLHFFIRTGKNFDCGPYGNWYIYETNRHLGALKKVSSSRFVYRVQSESQVIKSSLLLLHWEYIFVFFSFPLRKRDIVE